MPPPKKRLKTSNGEDRRDVSALCADSRVAWLVKGPNQMVDLIVKYEAKNEAKEVTLEVYRDVLTRNSEYFERCLKEPWTEAYKASVTFDDIEPKYLALFVGVACSCSSIVPMQPPQPSDNPQTRGERTPLKDFVEVYKLCDRFMCPVMSAYLLKCIKHAIGEGHRALFRSQNDKDLQRILMKDFADGYDALDTSQTEQKDLASMVIEYFCEGVGYTSWVDGFEGVLDRPSFVGGVSRGFAKKLSELQHGRRLKRKELSGPAS